MTGAKAILIIFGLATGHWAVLQFQALKPSMQLWAAHKLVETELQATGKADNDKMLLLCVRQLQDYEVRTTEAKQLLGAVSIASTDLK